MKAVLRCFLFLSLIRGAPSQAAIPTTRPLPKRIVVEANEASVLRDDEMSTTFYVAPRRYKVSSQRIVGSRINVSDCEVVDNYNYLLSSILKSKRDLAELSARVTALLLKVSEIQTDRSQLLEKRLELQKRKLDLEEESGVGSHAVQKISLDIAHVESKIAALEKGITENNNLIKTLDEHGARATLAQEARLTEIESLRFLMFEAVARLEIRLEVSPAEYSKDWKSERGFLANDSVGPATIIALRLSPVGDEGLGEGAENLAELDDQLKRFRPAWSVKRFEYIPFEINSNRFLTRDVQKDLPPIVFFTRHLTRIDFCALSQKYDLSKELVENLSISYEVPIFADEISTFVSGAPLFSHVLSVNPRHQTHLATAICGEGCELVRSIDDFGDPSRFTDRGTRIGFPVSTQIIMKESVL